MRYAIRSAVHLHDRSICSALSVSTEHRRTPASPRQSGSVTVSASSRQQGSARPAEQ